MRIRVLFVTENPDRPTTEVCIGCTRRGIDIAVVCDREHPNSRLLSEAGVPTLEIPFRRRIDATAIKALRVELIRRRYDIVHTDTNKALSNSLIASFALPVSIVAFRGIVGNVRVYDPVSWMRYLNPRIDRIVCVCNAVRNYFLNIRPSFLRPPPERVVTVYKGHRVEWYDAPKVDLREFGIPEGVFTICCVANYRPRKGIEYLIAAIDLLPTNLNVHLLLIGNMQNPAVIRAVNKSRAHKRIHNIGFRNDAAPIAASCDVFCLPSTKREGLSRSVIEAMSSGIMPIVTDCGGNSELVIDNQSGLVVPVRNARAIAGAIEIVYCNPQLRSTLGHNARQRIAAVFNIDSTIEEIASIYEELARSQSVAGSDSSDAWPGFANNSLS